MSTESAKALADRQRHYDRIHHSMRRTDLMKKSRLCWEERQMLIQSNAVLADESGVVGNRSVDLNDADYIRELDAYALENK